MIMETSSLPAPWRPPGDDLDALELLQEQFARTVEVAGEAGLGAPIPWCGTWRVRDLVDHLARIHHWAAARARREREAPLGRGSLPLPTFYREQAAELAGTLRALDPDAPAWTLLDDDAAPAEPTGTVRFWHRRQKLETLIHLWDLRTALGLDLGPLGPAVDAETRAALWEDCVAEVTEVMHPRQLRLGRAPAPGVRITLVDPRRGPWVLTGAPRGAPEVRITADALDLSLLLWGRARLGQARFAVVGEASWITEAERVLTTHLTP
ncbi:maleylpyruvate isomerase family mycothiol-dependent enzyme [Serinibacter salmoneus]|uniref:Uncharacterized protein (TIGR03083 family) n=1 Tax=Serinibacter salmoneus TaxID=556530 RepID=A0A2A9D2E9_9MICO|nr:maleylpyruvate isomerase family mycothiol-dependent enzyme [Serinibacter salmoneus]PFG20029.1 uncharacterized protein (TIGR03083 family) [Serinibacter salmoneus]